MFDQVTGLARASIARALRPANAKVGTVTKDTAGGLNEIEAVINILVSINIGVNFFSFSRKDDIETLWATIKANELGFAILKNAEADFYIHLSFGQADGLPKWQDIALAAADALNMGRDDLPAVGSKEAGYVPDDPVYRSRCFTKAQWLTIFKYNRWLLFLYIVQLADIHAGDIKAMLGGVPQPSGGRRGTAAGTG